MSRQFNTAVAAAELTTREARALVARAMENLDDMNDWGDIAFQCAIDDLQAAARALQASRVAGWQHAEEIPE